MTHVRTAPGLSCLSPSTASAFAQLGHQACVFGVETTSVHLLLRWWWRSVGIFVYCTVPRHMTSTTTDAANDVSSEVALLWTIVFAVTDTTTILTNLVFIVTQSHLTLPPIPLANLQ